MDDLHFNARSRSGSTWGGVVKGSTSRCAQRQFEAGASEIEIVGEQGRSVLRPGEAFVQVPRAHAVAPVVGTAVAASSGGGRRVALRIAFWLVALAVIGLVAGAVVTISAANVAITDQASVALKAKGHAGTVVVSLSDVEWDGGLVYRYQVRLDDRPVMLASYDVLGGEVRLGR